MIHGLFPYTMEQLKMEIQYYAQTAVLNDVNFTTNPLAASAIASGNVKTTIARMNGSYVKAEMKKFITLQNKY